MNEVMSLQRNERDSHTMVRKAMNGYLFLAGLLLIVTAAAKFIGSTGRAGILQSADPIIQMPFRSVFVLAGLVELLIGLACLFWRRVICVSMMLAWLATVFLIYRLGLVWVDYHKPCSCLGNLTEALGIAPESADIFIKCVLGYMLIGSYASLIWFWRNRGQITKTPV